MIFISVFVFVIIVGLMFLIMIYPNGDGANTASSPPAKKAQVKDGAVIVVGSQNFSVALNAPNESLHPGVAQDITAVIVGGTPPFNYTFVYTSNASSFCANGAAISSPSQSMRCTFAFTSSGSVSLTVVDSTGTVATSQMLKIKILKVTSTPTSAAFSTPTQVTIPIPTPIPTPIPIPIPIPIPTPISIAIPTPMLTPIPAQRHKPRPAAAVKKCLPLSVGFTCDVRLLCPNKVYLGMGPQMVATTTFNVTKPAGAVVSCDTTNVSLKSGQGIQNFQFTTPYFLTCSKTGAWVPNGAVFCRVDKILNATDPSCNSGGSPLNK